MDHIKSYMPPQSTTCRHCGAINQPNTVLCVGCGLNMQLYNASENIIIDETQQALDEKFNEKFASLQKAEAAKRKDEKKSFINRLLLVIAFAVVIGAAIFMTARLFINRNTETKKQGVAALENAINFLSKGDFERAIDYAHRATEKGVSQERAEPIVLNATIGLIQQTLDQTQPALALDYANKCLQMNAESIVCNSLRCAALLSLVSKNLAEKHWETAIKYGSTGAIACTERSQFDTLIEEAYATWYQSLLSEGKFAKAVLVLQKWKGTKID